MRRNPRELSLLNRVSGRRAVLLGGLQLAFAGGLALRMRYLQVEQADQFRLLAEENRVNIRLIPPPVARSSTATATCWRRMRKAIAS